MSSHGGHDVSNHRKLDCLFNSWLRLITRVRIGGFSKVVAIFNHVSGSFNIFMATTGDVWITLRIFSNLGLCAACWAHFMCHHKFWPTSVSHPFSSLNSSLGYARGKHCRKITIPIFKLVLQNLLFQVVYFILFSIAIFSPYFLLVVCFIAVCGFSPGK